MSKKEIFSKEDKVLELFNDSNRYIQCMSLLRLVKKQAF